MPIYSYVAVDRDGKKLRASLEAPDEGALRNELKEKNLIPLSINALEDRKPFLFERITKKDVLTFTLELGNLLNSGLPIDRALSILSEHTEKARLRAILRDVNSDIQRGQSLSQALSRHSVFPKLYVNMIRAGEAGGILEEVLKRLAVFLETTESFRDEVISALIYPLVLTSVGGLAVAVLMLYVVPRFVEIFEDMGQALPLPTEVLISISNWTLDYWWLMLGGLAASIILIRRYSLTPQGKHFIDGLKLRVPVVKDLHMRLVTARFARTLGTLLQGGVPVLHATRISREVVGNEVISERLWVLEDGIKKGRGVSAPLRESMVFPPIIGHMIAVGEEAGRLEDTFLMVADRFEAEGRRLIKRTLSLLEPGMILLMGIVVGFIVISMLIAVFSVNDIPI